MRGMRERERGWVGEEEGRGRDFKTVYYSLARCPLCVEGSGGRGVRLKSSAVGHCTCERERES